MIGETVYFFDINRRVYAKAEPGKLWGAGPIWREHWRPEKIVGETSRSWVTDHGKKVAKNAASGDGFAWSQADIERAAFVADHRYKIADAVGRLGYDQLAEVARLIGYPEAPLSPKQTDK